MTPRPDALYNTQGGTGRHWATSRLLLAGLLLSLIAATACTGQRSNEPGSTSKDQASTSASSHATLPNPFPVTDTFKPSALGLHSPIALAVGPNGDVYVTEETDAVAMVSPSGKVLRRWGTRGRGPGQFTFLKNGPSDWHASIAVGQDGRVYVSDSGNYRVQVFSATGRFLSPFGSQGSSAGQFLAPYDVAVDQADDVYVTDDTAETVSKFSSTGHFLWRIGGPSASDPDLVGGQHLASVDTHGRVVMLNAETGKILYVDANGHKVDAFAPSVDMCEVAVDSVGDTFTNGGGVCRGAGDSWVFDRTHRLIAGCAKACPLWTAPRFGPHGEAFALGKGGAILKLKVTLP